jgi:hypothetical protein
MYLLRVFSCGQRNKIKEFPETALSEGEKVDVKRNCFRAV